ncbi:MAG TPA: PQQ-binding-like beta-propeller repeat protein, partial [Xanthomonadales bacterium]|nr:PQQ-binding-like beta-propeller repeat protein [Xanthomonadales bacterium]
MKQAVSRVVISGALVIALATGAVSGARAGVVVPTQHNDNFRTGANLAETALTPAALTARGMQRVDRAVDGTINTQILYAPGVSVGGKLRNVAFVTTSANSVYAFDADDRTTGLQTGMLWRRSLADASASPPALPRGINATPVLEFAGGKGTIDVLYSTADRFPWVAVFVKDELELQAKLHVHYYLVKLDLATGKPVAGPRELSGSMPRNDGTVMSFAANNESDTASLLLDHGYLYASFSARQNENVSQYYGWMLRYSAADLSYAGAFNTQPYAWAWRGPGHPQPSPAATPTPSPNATPYITCYYPSGGRLEPWDTSWVRDGGANAMACVGEGGGIWQGGAGPAADGHGNVYVIVGNGHNNPHEGSYGDSIVRLHSKPGGGTTPADFGVDNSWAPPAEKANDEAYDVDLGSAGPMVVDGAQRVIAGGKTGIFYVVDDRLAPKQSIVAGVDHRALDFDGKLRYQTWNQGPHLHGSPTFWRVSDRTGYVYEWAEKDYLKKYEFDLRTGRFTVRHPILHPWVARETDILAAPCVMALLCLNAMPGGMLALSANGTDQSSGIVWAILRAYDLRSHDSIYAFDARTLKLLWSDPIGAVPHFAGPTVADGHVFVPTNSMQWRFTIYALGNAVAAKQTVRGAKRVWPPPEVARKMAMTLMMPMKIASPNSKVPDYAADPMYRARLFAPKLMSSLPSGTIVGAAYGVEGNEVYDCTSVPCTRTRTDVLKVHRYDDRPNAVAGDPVPLSRPCSYTATLAAFALPGTS